MKKILTALILLTFCTVQATWAGDVIIIGSDGQPRYEDESKNIPVTKEDIEKAKKKDILNEVTITDETGKRENIYINGKGKVIKVEEEQITEVFQPIDKDKETEHKKYIQNAPKILSDINSILHQCGYFKKDYSSEIKKEYMKMNLLDGDYVIGYKDAPYIAEYHKDGSLMGLVKIDKQVLDKDDTTINKANVVFYEYRLEYNTADNDSMGLKHVLFLDYEKENYLAQYIYKHDGTLLCRQINNDIYISSEARNMIPDWKKRKFYLKVHKQGIHIDLSDIIIKLIGGTCIAIGIPLLIIPPLGILFIFSGAGMTGCRII